MKKEFIVLLFSISFTIFGIVLIFKGQLTNGLLAMIVGELVDLPQRIAKELKT